MLLQDTFSTNMNTNVRLFEQIKYSFTYIHIYVCMYVYAYVCVYKSFINCIIIGIYRTPEHYTL